MNNCCFYIGDSGHHLYVHCSYKGLVTAKQCMDCRKNKGSNANEMIVQIIENDIKKQISDLLKGDKQ